MAILPSASPVSFLPHPSRDKVPFPMGWLKGHFLSVESGQEGQMEGWIGGRVRHEELLQITIILSREENPGEYDDKQ